MTAVSNSLLTIGGITKRAIALFLNSNAFIMNVDRQYDESFGIQGAKIGNTLRVRLPNDYVGVKTVSITGPQVSNEQEVPIVVATQATVPVGFTSADLSLNIDDLEYRVIKPAVNVLAGIIAADVMGLAETIPNYVSSAVQGSAISTSPTIATWLLAGAKLDQASAPRVDRKVVMDPITQARTVANFAGFFNPTGKISDQYDTGELTSALGYKWMMDQTTIVHNTAAYGTLPTVNGAAQTGSNITVSALTAPLNKGDIIMFAGVYAINRVTKQVLGTQQQQFVVTANLVAGATVIPIYPAMTPTVGGTVPYATVSASPANGATITCVNVASESYRKNFIFRPEAFALVMADLPIISKGVIMCARESYDRTSLRMVTSYDILNDQEITRLDALYGYALIRPEWACVVADLI